MEDDNVGCFIWLLIGAIMFLYFTFSEPTPRCSHIDGGFLDDGEVITSEMMDQAYRDCLGH